MPFKFNPFTGTLDLVGTSGGGSSNSFSTIHTDSGTFPVATSPTDTLSLTTNDADFFTFVGNAGTDTVTLTIHYTPESIANKVTDLSSPNNTTYPTTEAVANAIAAIPATLPGGFTGSIQFNNGSDGFGGGTAYTDGNFIALDDGNGYKFNGSGDVNWQIGRNIGLLNHPNLTSNVLEFIVGDGVGEGMVFGNNSGTYYLELDNNGDSYFSGYMDVVKTATSQGFITNKLVINTVKINSDQALIAAGYSVELTGEILIEGDGELVIV